MRFKRLGEEKSIKHNKKDFSTLWLLKTTIERFRHFGHYGESADKILNRMMDDLKRRRNDNE